VSNNIIHQLGVSFAFTLWVGARVLLVHGSTIEKYVSQDIHFLVSTLENMGKYWPLATRYATILSRVIEEYEESQERTISNGKTETPPSVTILADMRRTALDLEVLISKAPRQKQVIKDTPQPSRNALPSEAEFHYLEAFDFFNYPRLAASLTGHTDSIIDTTLQRFDENQFNINNFSIDVNSDWLAGNFT
jgi:hypothetical protein